MKLEYFARRLKTSKGFGGEGHWGGYFYEVSLSRGHLGTALSEVLISWHWVTLKDVTSPWRVIDETGYGHFWYGIPFSVSGSLGKDSHVRHSWFSLKAAMLTKESLEWHWVLCVYHWAIYLHVRRSIYTHTHFSHAATPTQLQMPPKQTN